MRMKLFGAEKDSDLFLYDEETGKWKKLDDKTVRWFRMSMFFTKILEVAWLLVFFYTMKLISVLHDQRVQIPANALLMLLLASTGVVVLGRRADYVLLEHKRGDTNGSD